MVCKTYVSKCTVVASTVQLKAFITLLSCCSWLTWQTWIQCLRACLRDASKQKTELLNATSYSAPKSLYEMLQHLIKANIKGGKMRENGAGGQKRCTRAAVKCLFVIVSFIWEITKYFERVPSAFLLWHWVVYILYWHNFM